MNDTRLGAGAATMPVDGPMRYFRRVSPLFAFSEASFLVSPRAPNAESLAEREDSVLEAEVPASVFDLSAGFSRLGSPAAVAKPKNGKRKAAQTADFSFT